MKLLFLGDTMFGRHNNPFIKNPFKYLSNAIQSFKSATLIFNLETVISVVPLSENLREGKMFNYHST